MTTFHGPYVEVFGHQVDETQTIDRIEIPLIQRDYAQGRDTPEVELIRTDFLDVLVNAISEGPAVGLDFVYGDVKNGVLRPLDGQQRLTTLFLLHWYLASRIGELAPDLPWTKFGYATRPSARLFCERIVQHPSPADTDDPAQWIADQPWFQYLWLHDPTIQAMLTMIRAIHDACAHLDPRQAWNRMTDVVTPAISFHLLPIDEAGEGDTLYIKMNSRGRPLTRFENFKARFERSLEGSPRAKEFSTNVDGIWSDLFWPFRDDDNKTDTQFQSFFLFIIETLEWRGGHIVSGRADERAERIFGTDHDPHGENLDFLIGALNSWAGVEDIEAYLEHLFEGPIPGVSSDAIPLFGVGTTNLFKECADNYGSYVNKTRRSFGLAETLMLYAVQLHLMWEAPKIERRLRTLRNLTENSTNEVRLEAMPALLASVERFMSATSHEQGLETLDAFSAAQIGDEKDKARFLTDNPELESVVFKLEDDPVLRGSLVGFELNPTTFTSHAASFLAVMSDTSTWPALTGALLACGDYSRSFGSRFIRFGSGSDPKWWRELLTGGSRSSLVSTARPLGTLLGELASSDDSVIGTLNTITNRWLAAQSSFDWRYYLVKYPIMRSGRSGIYTGQQGHMGYQLCMLDRTQMNSWYRDPFLSAIVETSGAENSVDSLWFMGYENLMRWMHLEPSGVGLRCLPEGFALTLPTDQEITRDLSPLLRTWGVEDDLILRVNQIDGVDIEDRIDKCARFVVDLLRPPH